MVPAYLPGSDIRAMSAAGNGYNRRPVLQWRFGHDRAKEQALVEQFVAHPILAAMEETAAHREGCSVSCWTAIRTARARISGENLFVVLLVIDPTSHELGSPANSGGG